MLAKLRWRKLDKIGEPTEEERLEWKYLPEGEKLAARYLNHEAELSPEISKFDKKAAPYVIEGVSNVLIKNIILPETIVAKKSNKLAMDGIKAVKTDKAHVEAVLKSNPPRLQSLLSNRANNRENKPMRC